MKSILKNTDSTKFNKKEGSRTALLSSSVFVTCFWVQWSLAAKPSVADGRKKQYITIRIRRKAQTNCEECLAYFLPYSGCMKKELLECCYVICLYIICVLYISNVLCSILWELFGKWKETTYCLIGTVRQLVQLDNIYIYNYITIFNIIIEFNIIII